MYAARFAVLKPAFAYVGDSAADELVMSVKRTILRNRFALRLTTLITASSRDRLQRKYQPLQHNGPAPQFPDADASAEFSHSRPIPGPHVFPPGVLFYLECFYKVS